MVRKTELNPDPHVNGVCSTGSNVVSVPAPELKHCLAIVWGVMHWRNWAGALRCAAGNSLAPWRCCRAWAPARQVRRAFGTLQIMLTRSAAELERLAVTLLTELKVANAQCPHTSWSLLQERCCFGSGTYPQALRKDPTSGRGVVPTDVFTYDTRAPCCREKEPLDGVMRREQEELELRGSAIVKTTWCAAGNTSHRRRTLRHVSNLSLQPRYSRKQRGEMATWSTWQTLGGSKS